MEYIKRKLLSTSTLMLNKRSFFLHTPYFKTLDKYSGRVWMWLYPLTSSTDLLVDGSEDGVQLKRGGTRWRTGGEVKGKLANGVATQYPSHFLGTWCIQHYYRRCAHFGCQQSTELTPPGRFKWTRPFRRKMKSGFCACAITFQSQSTTRVSNRGLGSGRGSMA